VPLAPFHQSRKATRKQGIKLWTRRSTKHMSHALVCSVLTLPPERDLIALSIDPATSAGCRGTTQRDAGVLQGLRNALRALLRGCLGLGRLGRRLRSYALPGRSGHPVWPCPDLRTGHGEQDGLALRGWPTVEVNREVWSYGYVEPSSCAAGWTPFSGVRSACQPGRWPQAMSKDGQFQVGRC